MKRTVDLGVTEKAYILAGIGPIRSVKIAEWMRLNVPGVVIPDGVIKNLRGVPPKSQREEGKKLCIDMIAQIKDIPGVSGVHVMAYRQEELVAEIIDGCGIMARRKDYKPKP
jgi:methylenetetrahydrofolate reductase (NADPH)